MDYRLILASQSPRRKQLLTRAGFRFEVMLPCLEECVDPSWTPEECAWKLARQKAENVVSSLAKAATSPKQIVLAADTVVALDERIFGKPESAQHAYEMLWLLSRNRHRVVTGVCLWPVGEEPLIAWDVTYVRMRPMTDSELWSYVESGEGTDKAGGYAIQESADRYIESIAGAYDNVVGLPVGLVRELLGRWQSRCGV